MEGLKSNGLERPGYGLHHESTGNACHCTKDKVWAYTKKRIPILAWLPNYKWQSDFSGDLFAGITLAFVNVPQALAFAILANAPLISGLYTACFTALVYSFLGTARISSFGPIAVGSMFTGEAVAGYMTAKNMSVTPDGTDADHQARVTYIATLTFTIGLMYLSFFLLRISAIRILFTKAFINGLISGLAVQVLLKTLKMVLGIKIPSHYGFFVVFKNVKDIADKIPDIHQPTLIFSIIVFAILIFNMFVIKKFVAKFTTFIFPIEAITLLSSIAISYYYEFHNMGIETVGFIPKGLPELSPIDLSMIVQVIPDAVAISTINYATALSMVIAFNPGVIDANQETLAMATANLFCSNIQCITIGNAMIRTILVMNVGIKTQLTTIISSIILFLVLMFAGPLFEPLPTAVLGCIIILAIMQLLVGNLQAVPGIFRTSVEDGVILATVFLVTTFLDMQMGLITGFILTLRQLLVRVISEDQKKEEAKQEVDLRDVEASRPENERLLEIGRKMSLSNE